MIPSLKLGPWDSPQFEISHDDLYLITCLIIEHYPGTEDESSMFSLLQLDGTYLDEDTNSLFLKFEAICTRILSGELTKYDSSKIQTPEFCRYIRKVPDHGIVTPAIERVAQAFLDFLASHPEHWPWK